MKVKTTNDSTSPRRQRRINGRMIDGFRPWGSLLIFLLLCAHLIFCHGCHGKDVDDELCVPPPVAQDGERSASAGWYTPHQPADADRSPFSAVPP
jgi:hypothetical protein